MVRRSSGDIEYRGWTVVSIEHGIASLATKDKDGELFFRPTPLAELKAWQYLYLNHPFIIRLPNGAKENGKYWTVLKVTDTDIHLEKKIDEETPGMSLTVPFETFVSWQE